jgi:Immunoglobulin domain
MLSVLSVKSYPGVITVMTSLGFSGNGVTIDSFDSSNPYHSDWQTNITYHGSNFFGTYPTNPMAMNVGADYTNEPYRRKDNAVVSTKSTSLTVQNVNIAGYLDTASGGTAYINANGIVGSVDYVFNFDGTINSANANTIENGHILNDTPTNFPDVALPAVTFTNLSVVIRHTGPVTTTNYTISQSGYWAITNNINAKNNNTSDPVSINIDCQASNVILWLPTGINYKTGNTITVESNCDLTILGGRSTGTGDSISLSGQGSIANYNQYAGALTIRGLPSCSSIDFGGPASFVGCIYAPEANLSLGGGGSDTYDFIGALTVNNLNFGGHVNFHYDEAVGGFGFFPKLIVSSPTNRAVPAGSNTTFTVSTTFGSPVAYRWYFNQTNLIAFQTNFATFFPNVSLTLTNVQPTNTGNYSVVLSNLAGFYAPLTSSVASLAVGTLPVILTNPVGGSIIGGYDFPLSVTASNALTYQWMFYGTNILGATNSTLLLTNIQSYQNGSYTVRAINPYGSTLSAEAEVLVYPAYPHITAQPTNVMVAVGGTASFSLSFFGSPPNSFQWRFNGTNVFGATNLVLTKTNIQLSDAGNYSVAITNPIGATNSANAALIVFTNATATLSGVTTVNSQLQFNINGVTGLTYVVQSSTNLFDWLPQRTNVSPFTFIDTNVDLPYRFYRAVYFP